MNNNNVSYTNVEKIDMLLIYGECRKNSREARALYATRYPERRIPYHTYFRKVEQQMRRNPIRNEQNRMVINENMEINIIGYVYLNPTASVREIAFEVDISRESVRQILKKHNYRSYKYNLHQHLYDGDAVRRLEYCTWLTNKYNEDNNFIKNILFTDESRFCNNAMFNRQNVRYWSQNNRRIVRPGRFQERFGVNIWAGVLGNRIFGPILFQGTLTGARYLNFLRHHIQNELDDLPLLLYRNIYFQQDGAPPHNTREVSQYLLQTFGDNVISTHGPVRWPARSPDLTPLDFFLWGYIKSLVYITPVMTLQELEHRILRAFETITPEMLERVAENNLRRARECRAQNGGHFEQMF